MLRSLIRLVLKLAFRRGFTCEARRARANTRRSSQVKPLLLLRLFILNLLGSLSTLSAETLESSNPFLPSGYGEKKEEAPRPVVQTNGPISREMEFRGLVKIDGQYQFSLFNKSEQTSYWLKENKAAAQGITVRGYDADSRTITVNMNGRSERLTLMAASSAPLPVQASVTGPSNANASQPVLPPGLQNVTNGNNNSDNRRVVPRRRVILPKK